MTDKIYDLCIIGGGINGTAIALAAAAQGLSVCLCEQNDLGSGTSAWSTKLIHGGLRYLEQYKFSLVRKSLRERDTLLKLAPYLIRPLEFIFPHQHHLRPRWIIRLGLFLYDHLFRSVLLPRSKAVSLCDGCFSKPLVNEIKYGFSYYDAATDDSRLVILTAMTARQHGADIFPRTRCNSVERNSGIWRLNCASATNVDITLQAKVLVNATGPWVNDFMQLNNCFATAERATLVKGSHIVVPKMYSGEHAYILQDENQRIIFTIPYQRDFTLIGTTDESFSGNPKDANINDAEIEYLLDTLGKYFKQVPDGADIVWKFSGVRALYCAANGNLQRLSREHHIAVESDQAAIHLIGGKLTTHRQVAAEVVDHCKQFLTETQQATVVVDKLVGCDFGEASYASYVETCKAKYSWLPPELLQHYLSHYGSNLETLLESCTCMNDLGQHFAAGLYAKEIDYLCEYEWAMTVEDVIWRRTKYGLKLNAEQITILSNYIAEKNQ